MSIRAVALALTQRGRWSYLLYFITLLAIATGQMTLRSGAAGSVTLWMYLLSVLLLLAQGFVQERRPYTPFYWMWVALALVGACLAMTGGLDSGVYPLVYLFWVAVPTWVQGPRALGALALGYLGIDLAMTPMTSEPGILVAEHLLFSALFLASHRLLFGGYLKWLRSQQKVRLAEQHQAYVRDAEDFRLGRPGAQASRATAQEASVTSIHGTIDYEIDLLCESLSMHTLLLLWPDEAAGQGHWRIKAHRSAQPLLARETVADFGLLAPLQKGLARVQVSGGVQERHRFYYQDGTVPVQELCAVAIPGGSMIQGVLVADRIQAEPFTPSQCAILERAAEHLMRCLAQERAFTELDRQKQVHARLHAASVRLNQALGMAELQQSSLEALSMLVPNDLALLFAVSDEPSDQATMSLVAQRVASDREMEPQWQGCLQAWRAGPRSLSDSGMVGSARKNRVKVIPKRPAASSEGLCVFGDGARLQGAGSVVVLPLTHADGCDAVAVLVSRQEEAFESELLTSASILVHQIGASMQNARLYDQMQRQATTDGLTGLANHRTFQARLQQAIAHTRRTEQPLSLILTDIDHFKQVNDRYGHPVGDAVLQSVAEILGPAARLNDLVARYGGEEFVLLLPGSDEQAATALAQRLRQEVAAQPMVAKDKSFHVTLSLGISQWQGPGDSGQALVDRADQALYACKAAGRNCVLRWGETVSL